MMMNKQIDEQRFYNFKEVLLRLFLGRVKVRHLQSNSKMFQVFSLYRSIPIHKILSEVHVSTLSLLENGTQHEPYVSTLSLLKNDVQVHSVVLSSFLTRVHSFKTRMNKVTIKSGIQIMRALPQTRENRSSSHLLKPRKDGHAFLALFSPIIEKALVKSVLNKETGTLLIWYNSQSRSFFSQSLVLFSRLGKNGGLVWEWHDLPHEMSNFKK